MRIGIDFDNTIANYTGVFYRVACELGWLPSDIGQSKSAVKQYFLAQDREATWTELQGIVYGKEINQAQLYPYVRNTIVDWLAKGHQVFIISHKTRFPIIGDKVNFHDAARNWLMSNDIVGKNCLPLEQVFFNETKEKKLTCIASLSCDVFIDDLPSILMHADFPASTAKVLFDPKDDHSAHDLPDVVKATSWQSVAELY